MASRSIFQSMVEDWADRGLIEQDQLPVLLDDLSRQQTNVSNRGIILVLGMIGAVCITAAVFLFIASNWSWIPRPAKAVVALSLPVIVVWLSALSLRTLPLLSRSMRLLAVLMVGASIAILGQVYAVDGSEIGLLRLWGAIGIVLAFVLVTEFGVVAAYLLLSGGVIIGLLSEVRDTSWLSVVGAVFVASWIGYGLAYLFVWGAQKAGSWVPERLMPNGDVIKAMSLVGVWLALLGAYPSFRFEEIGSSDYFALYLVGYVSVLGLMIFVGNRNGRPLMRNGSIFMALVLLFILYCDVFGRYATQAVFYLGAGLLLTALAVVFERAIRLVSKKGAG